VAGRRQGGGTLKPVHLVTIPFILGRSYNAAPSAPEILTRAIARRLSDRGVPYRSTTLERPAAGLDDRALVEFAVRGAARASAEDGLAVVVAGNCVTALGALGAFARVGALRPGVIWFDAHGDFNTPEISLSGSLDGMPLAIATGRCHREILTATGQPAIDERAIVLAGVRDTDPDEKLALAASGVTVVAARDVVDQGVREAFEVPIRELSRHVDVLYIHFDLDGIDPAEAPGVGYRAPDGVGAEDVLRVIQLAGDRFPLCAASIAAYDPARDRNHATRDVAVRIAEAFARRANDGRNGAV